jgi:hypothetical protein
MNTIYRTTKIILTISILFFFAAETINAYPSGISGATKKSGNSGCGCHGSSYFNTTVSVIIDGPDTLYVNQTGTYTVTVSGGPNTKAGVDIAASNDNLVPVSTYLKVLNSELTHTSAVNYVSGQVVFEFSYTAPDTALPQIIYATGSSRKYWNWAENKPIVVLPVTPVELISFNGSVFNNSVVLNWKTGTETNNKGFMVERKLNEEWQNISFIPGKGTTSKPNEYNFTDNNIAQDFAGNVRYRLNQVDYNGANHYSNVIELSVSSPDKFELLQNYPNPFNPSTIIEYNLTNNGNKSMPVTLKIYDVLGNELITLVDTYQSAGTHKVEFNGNGLSSGVYIYQLKSENLTLTKKMVLNK